MAHDDTIGYALDLLDADERAALEARLAASPESASQVERVRAIAALLELDRDDLEPPLDLATRTISRFEAEFAQPSTLEAARKAFSTDQPEGRSFTRRFRGDLVVAAGIGLFVVGLALSFVARARQASEMLACQNNLLTLHQGLSGYADAHEGRFPKVGTEAYPTADAFVQALKDAGQCPAAFHAICPAANADAPVTYTYALGHRTANNVVLGEWRSTDPAVENDLIPIAADCPAAAAAPGGGPTSAHRTGHNVLFVGGNVRFAKTATVGVNGDDIFRNQLGAVAAGVTRVDTVLGRAG
ncbi:MAG TPA: hypothetical protein VGI99_04225, partial [Gemmataceae bacterium]